MEKPTQYNDLLDNFVKTMHGKLENEGVKVKQDLLKKVLTEAEKEVKDGCDSCANGWHW